MKVQANYFNNNLLIFDVKQLKNHTLPLKAPWDGQCKIRCIMGCPGLKTSYREKGLIVTMVALIKCTLEKMLFTVATLGGLWARDFFFRHWKNLHYFLVFMSLLWISREEKKKYFL